MDKTEKLLDQISTLARGIAMSAEDADIAVMDARYTYDGLAREELHIARILDEEYLRDDFGEEIEMAAEYMQDAHVALGELDEQLMKLIHLRGKLAEEIGVPIGGKQWVRYETLTM
jgi:hypothetical protein